MKLTICTLLFALAVSASPAFVCPPSFAQDGIPVTATCPGNSYQIVVEPSTFIVSFNDNSLSQGIGQDGFTGDGDFNDAWIFGLITPGPTPQLDQVWISWGGALSAWHNEMFIGTTEIDASTQPSTQYAGLFAAGNILPISAVAGDGTQYFGDPAFNPGGVDHFWEAQTFAQACPEPSAVWLGAAGLLALTARAYLARR
jgi:hypothetical protein